MFKRKKVDIFLLLAYGVLSILGLLLIYSASSYRLTNEGNSAARLFAKQLFILAISWLSGLMIFFVKPRILLSKTLAMILILVSSALLLLTHIGGLGVSINGAKRWFSIFGIQFQPSEIAYVAIILYLSYYFKDSPIQSKKWLPPFAVIGFLALLILVQPKVSGALIAVILGFFLMSMYCLTFRHFLFFLIGGISSLLGVQALVSLLGNHHWLPRIFAHTYQRISTLKNPFLDPLGNGYQSVQSYYALYNGGFFGRGLGNSLTKKGYLPEAETDFIFVVLTEELGLLVALVVLALLIGISLRLFLLGTRSKNNQIGTILIGVGLLIGLETAINVASVIGLIPMTGIPLPFLSYGGTNYLILSFSLVLCLKLSAIESEAREFESI